MVEPQAPDASLASRVADALERVERARVRALRRNNHARLLESSSARLAKSNRLLETMEARRNRHDARMRTSTELVGAASAVLVAMAGALTRPRSASSSSPPPPP